MSLFCQPIVGQICSRIFLQKVEKIRSLVPEVTISTDIIVGFPGESVEDFEDTMDVVRRSGFEFMYSFGYSPRPHTSAAELVDQIDDETKSERLSALHALQMEIQDKAHARNLGAKLEVLFENFEDGFCFGKSSNGFVVKVPSGESWTNNTKTIKITKCGRHNLTGELA